MVNRVLSSWSIYMCSVCWVLLLTQSPRCLWHSVKQAALRSAEVRSSCTTIRCVLLVLKFASFWLAGIIWRLKFASLIKYIPIFTKLTRVILLIIQGLFPGPIWKWWKLWVFSAYDTHTHKILKVASGVIQAHSRLSTLDADKTGVSLRVQGGKWWAMSVHHTRLCIPD